MADIKPYNPGATPSLDVGSPGANYAPGQAFRSEASNLGQLRQQFAQTRASGNAAVLNPLSNLGVIAGRFIAAQRYENKQNKIKLQNAVAAQAANKTIFDFKSTADQTRWNVQQQFQDRPSDGQEQFNGSLDANMQSTIDSFGRQWGPTNPEAYNKVAEQLQNHVLSQREKIESWTLSTQTDQAHAFADNVVNNGAQEVSSLSGPLPDRVLRYKEILGNAHESLINSEPQLGAANTAKLRLSLAKQMPSTLFENMMTTLPEDPEKRMGYIQTARTLLDNSETMGIRVDAKDKVALQRSMDVMQNQSESDLVGKYAVDVYDSDANIKMMRMTADASWNNEGLQNKTMVNLQHLKDGIGQELRQTEQVDAPERVKKAKFSLLATKTDQIDSAINRVKGNLQFIETERNKGIQQALSDRRHAQEEERRAAKEKLASDRKDSLLELNDMHNNMTVLLQSPTENHKAIVELGGELYDYAETMGKAGIITASQAGSRQRMAQNIMKTADSIGRNPPTLFQQWLPWLPQPQDKKLPFDKSEQQRSADLKAIVTFGQQLKDVQTNEKTNEITGLTGGLQQDKFAQKFDEWTQQRDKIGKPPTTQEKTDFTNKLRTWVLQNVPGEHEPTGRSDAIPGPYTTALNPDQEQAFKGWVKSNGIPWRDEPHADYDMRGYYQDIASKGSDSRKKSEFDGKPHFPDTYKTPYHKTFSEESKYAVKGKAPHWVGNRLIAANGKVVADETPQ